MDDNSEQVVTVSYLPQYAGHIPFRPEYVGVAPCRDVTDAIPITLKTIAAQPLQMKRANPVLSNSDINVMDRPFGTVSTPTYTNWNPKQAHPNVHLTANNVPTLLELSRKRHKLSSLADYGTHSTKGVKMHSTSRTNGFYQDNIVNYAGYQPRRLPFNVCVS